MPFSSVLGANSVIRPGVCTSATRPTVPYDGQVIYETDSNTLAVYDGGSWVSLNPVDRDRNVVINGAMQIAQRGTSTASITASAYYTADRWRTLITSLGTWTQSVENDAPTGSGFRKSLKMNCTTADASPAAGDLLIIGTALEGQNLQQFLKGTASAKKFTMTFWVKGSTTGTYIAELYDEDNSRSVSKSYTIDAANTWEKKTIDFGADTTGAFDNDNARSLEFNFWLGAGTNWTSGTLATTWASTTSANRAVGQTNLAGATNREWSITGVQLEVGSVATPFEFENISTTLAKCQRYFATKTSFDNMGGGTSTSTNLISRFVFVVQMRATPTVAVTSGSWVVGNDYSANYTATTVTVAAAHMTNGGGRVALGGFSSLPASGTQLGGSDADGTATLQFSAEL